MVFVGIIVVIGSVLGGFSIAGGHIPALFHVSEIVVICGTALGAVIISTPIPVLKSVFSKLLAIMKPTAIGKAVYLDALKMLFELFQIARREGLVAIEEHIEEPGNSELFKKYPKVMQQHHAIVFLCDSLRLVLMGSVPALDLEMLLDNDIDVHHEEEEMPVMTLQTLSDSLPGIGIVAAVLGIVVTMGAIAGPIEAIGHHVAAALTGTFLGVLLAYGFVAPMAASVTHLNIAQGRFHHFIKASVVAFAKGFPPLVAVEFARRSIFSGERPSFVEMEANCKGQKAEGVSQKKAA